MIIKIRLIKDFIQKKITIIEKIGGNPNEDDLFKKIISIKGLEKLVKSFINNIEIIKINGLENDFMDFIRYIIEKKQKHELNITNKLYRLVFVFIDKIEITIIKVYIKTR